MSALELCQLVKTYGDGTRAVKGIDLVVSRGEFLVLLGPSGCGKTTTLRMTAGLELPTAGTILLGGRDVTHLKPSQRDVAMVFQFYALYPHLTARDNIAFPLRAAGVGAVEARARVDAIAARMNLRGLLGHYPRQLSGADQQKVSLARAIVRSPSLYLMDEPLGTLDSAERLDMREIIRAEQLASKITTLYVTHDQEEAMSLADRIVVMDSGVIRQIGTPAEVYDRPADLFVATFVGSPGMNLVPGEIAPVSGSDGRGAARFVCRASGASSGSSASLPLDLPHPLPFGRAMLGIRCEHLHEDPAGTLLGRVVTEEYLGSARNVHLDTEIGRLIMRSGPASVHGRGSEVRLRLDPRHVSLFDASTEDRL